MFSVIYGVNGKVLSTHNTIQDAKSAAMDEFFSCEFHAHSTYAAMITHPLAGGSSVPCGFIVKI